MVMLTIFLSRGADESGNPRPVIVSSVPPVGGEGIKRGAPQGTAKAGRADCFSENSPGCHPAPLDTCTSLTHQPVSRRWATQR